MPNDNNISINLTGLVSTTLSFAFIGLNLLSMLSLEVVLEMQVINTPNAESLSPQSCYTVG